MTRAMSLRSQCDGKLSSTVLKPSGEGDSSA
jgi:hypothetical protein